MQNNKINYFKYKYLIFIVFVFTLIFAVIGVVYFRNIYYILTVFALIYTLLKYTQMIFILVYVIYRLEEAIYSFKKRQKSYHCSMKQITNVLILPNYNQDESLLKQSISNLSMHSRAKNYCLYLAMEKHQPNSQIKAKKLISQYSQRFRLMSYTIHQLQPGQSKSKASNINWCGNNMYKQLVENYVNLDTVMITIMDSDSLIPQAYIDQVQRHIQQNYDKRHTFIYQPPQIFSKNQREAAFFVRIVDTLMSFIQVANLYSIFNFTMGVSNYTISYRLLQRIGFWDICKYSKGQDLRITSKAIWKTNGQAKTCPIYVPINQLNLTTNKGYWQDFKARLSQAKKHSQDQVEISYNIVNSCYSKINCIRKFHILFTIFQVYAMLVIVPIPALVLIFQDIFDIIPRSYLDDGNSFFIFNNFNSVIWLMSFVLYHLFKRRASMQFFNIKPLNFFYELQVPLLQIPVALIFGFFPMVTASYNLLMDDITFAVTPKGKSQIDNKIICNPQEQSFFKSQQYKIDKINNEKQVISEIEQNLSKN